MNQTHDDAAAEREELAERVPPGHPIHAEIGRLTSDTYAFWRLCGRAACRRAGRCNGDPNSCCAACMPLLSDAVLAGGDAMFEGRRLGLSFDEARARWPEELTALATWRNAIGRPRRGRPGPRPAPAACAR